MEYTVTYITLVTGIVTIIWFVRDVHRQNSIQTMQDGIQKELRYIAELLAFSRKQA